MVGKQNKVIVCMCKNDNETHTKQQKNKRTGR